MSSSAWPGSSASLILSVRTQNRWWVIAGLFGVLLLSSGFGFYNLSVYVNVFAEAMGATVGATSVLVSLFFVVGGIAGIFVADLMERVPLRALMLAGAALSGASLGLAGEATALWQLWLLFVVFGIGNAGISIIISTSLIAQWFPGPNRSVALSIASTGLSVGGVVVTPISAYYLEQLGVAAVMPWIGAVFFLLLVPIIVFLIDAPPRPAAPSQDAPKETPAEVMRAPFFVLHTLSYVLLMGVQVGGIAHLYSRAEELSDFSAAAICVQLLSAASILSRFLGGWLLLRIPAIWFTVANLVLQTLGIFLIVVADTAGDMYVAALVFGASVGNLLMLQPLQLAETYGADVLARVFAVANAVTLIGVGLGPFVIGTLRDAASYDLAYAVMVAVSCVALAVLLLASRYRSAG